MRKKIKDLIKRLISKSDSDLNPPVMLPKICNQEMDPDLPIETAPYVAIDTELTGLDQRHDSIVALGAVKMLGGRINMADKYQELVRPRTELKADGVVIHGITPDELDNMPPIDEVLPRFLDFCAGHVLVGYKSQIDILFLNREFKRTYRCDLDIPVIDINVMYKWLQQRQGLDHSANLSLYEIAARFDIKVRGAHSAIADAYMTAQVFQRLLPKLREFGIINLEDLVHISSMPTKNDRFRFSSKSHNL